MLSAKVDAMTHRLDQMNVNAVNSSVPSPHEICGSIEHVTLNCQVRSPFSQDRSVVNYVKISIRDGLMTLTLVSTVRVGRVI